MKNIGLILITITLFGSSCKKGKDDPSLSLMSRKARIVREWNINKFVSNVKTVQIVGGNESEVFTDFLLEQEAVTINTTPNGFNSPNLSGKTITSTWDIKKDFTWERELTYEVNDNGIISTSYTTDTGSWGFLNKSEEAKNKEYIYFNIKSRSGKLTTNDTNSGNTNEDTYSDNYSEGEEVETFALIMLKNKEVKMEYTSKKERLSSSNNTTVINHDHKSYILKK